MFLAFSCPGCAYLITSTPNTCRILQSYEWRPVKSLLRALFAVCCSADSNTGAAGIEPVYVAPPNEVKPPFHPPSPCAEGTAPAGIPNPLKVSGHESLGHWQWEAASGPAIPCLGIDSAQEPHTLSRKGVGVACDFPDSLIIPAASGTVWPQLVAQQHMSLQQALQQAGNEDPWQASASAIVLVRREWYDVPQTGVRRNQGTSTQKFWRAVKQLKQGKVCCGRQFPGFFSWSHTHATCSVVSGLCRPYHARPPCVEASKRR